jgi:hypothetical protein
MKSHMARRVCRVEKQTDNLVSYRESAELGLALLGLFKAARFSGYDACWGANSAISCAASWPASRNATPAAQYDA